MLAAAAAVYAARLGSVNAAGNGERGIFLPESGDEFSTERRPVPRAGGLRYSCNWDGLAKLSLECNPRQFARKPGTIPRAAGRGEGQRGISAG